MTSRAWLMLTVALASGAASFTAAVPARALTNCIDDRDCSGATPVCNGGVCAECTQGKLGACAGRTPTCLPQGVCGCSSDTECGVGFVCNANAPRYCTAGCGTAGNADCPANFTCGGGGQCSRGCAVDANCSAGGPRNKCSIVLVGQCIECANNTDCAGKTVTPFCDTNTNTCVQCLTVTTNPPSAECASSPHGKVCLAGAPKNSCGCNSDSDCAVGKICDATVKTCIDGCRTSTGARCPPGNQCRADGCVPIDGGTGGGPDAGNGNDAGGEEEDAGNEEDAGSGGHRRDAGTDAGQGGGLLSDHPDSSLEGGGWSCSMTPSEDALPLGGLFTLGGLAALFARRRRSR